MACRFGFIVAILAAWLVVPPVKARAGLEPSGIWLTQAGAPQVDAVSSALINRIVEKLESSPAFEGRPDRIQVEAALERIAHRVLVQRDWDDEPAQLAAAS